MQPVPFTANFSPGRGINKECLSQYASYSAAESCIMNPSGSGGGGGLINQNEYVSTASNSSKFSQVYLTDGMAVLGPADPPPDMDFSATSFGARTICEVVTSQCNAKYIDPEGDDADRDVTFSCAASTSGLDLVGNFSNLNSASSGWPRESKNDLQNSIGSTVGGDTGAFGFQFYSDAQKTKLDIGHGIPSRGDIPHIWFAWVFQLSAGFGAEDDDSESGDVNNIGLTLLPDGGLGGIISCSTDLFDVVSRSSRQRSIINHMPSAVDCL